MKTFKFPSDSHVPLKLMESRFICVLRWDKNMRRAYFFLSIWSSMSCYKLVSNFFLMDDWTFYTFFSLKIHPNYPIKIIVNSPRIVKFYYSIIINPIQSTFFSLQIFFQGLVNDKKQLKSFFYLLAAIHFSPRDCFF